MDSHFFLILWYHFFVNDIVSTFAGVEAIDVDESHNYALASESGDKNKI